MGKRKRLSAEQANNQRKATNYAILRDSPVSARKMRLVADLVRGMEVEKALNVLAYTPKDAAVRVRKLLLSAISNWEQKNKDSQNTVADLFIKSINVDEAKTLKRINPSAQGRAFRIRKRSNHVTLFLDIKKSEE